MVAGENQWAETRTLIASDGEADDSFGVSTAISGETIVVGDEDHDMGRGAVLVFERDAGGEGNWGEVRRLTAPEPMPSEFYGGTVAIEGDTVAVGVPDYTLGNQSPVYLYHRHQGGLNEWGEVRKLTSPTPGDTGWFGNALENRGDLLLVGALSDLVDGSRPGAVYLFNRHAGGFNQWRQQAWFSSSDGGSGDRFGTSIAANGTRVLVGASYASIDLSRNGAAYLYEVEPALTGQRFLPLTSQ